MCNDDIKLLMEKIDPSKLPAVERQRAEESDFIKDSLAGETI